MPIPKQIQEQKNSLNIDSAATIIFASRNAKQIAHQESNATARSKYMQSSSKGQEMAQANRHRVAAARATTSLTACTKAFDVREIGQLRLV